MDTTVAEKLCAIRENVADLIGPSRYRTWFGDTTTLALAGDNLDVTVANRFVGSWIHTNYLSELVEATRRVVGREPRVAVHIADPDSAGTDGKSKTAAPRPARPPAVPKPDPAPSARSPSTPRPNLRGELDSFVVGPSNELAFSVASVLVRAPGEAFKHLVIHGGCGLGKTHLLQGLCNAIRRARPALEWRYLSGEEFTNEFVHAVKAGRIDLFRARFRNVDVLAIDDIHFLANKKATQEEFLHTFNAIDAAGKTVVLSSDRHPRSIATLSEPLINRLIAAMVVEIEPPDFATRREILHRRARTMLLKLPDEFLDYIAHHITRNVRELEGALYKLTAYASLTKESIGLELVRRTVADYVATKPPQRSAQIEELAAAYFGTTVEDIRSSSRERTVTQARAFAMYLLRKHTRMSFPEIGRQMGNKQHSTVLMAVRRVQELLDRDDRVIWNTPSGPREILARTVLDTLEQRLSRGPDA